MEAQTLTPAMASIMQDTRPFLDQLVLLPGRTTETPSSNLTSRLLSNTFKSRHLSTTMQKAPIELLPREILDDILSLVFSESYTLDEWKVQGLQPHSKLSILRTSSAISIPALEQFYSIPRFKINAWFKKGRVTPLISQPQASLMGNVSFKISPAFAKQFLQRDPHSPLYQAGTRFDPSATVLHHFVGASTTRTRCSLEYRLKSRQSPLALMDLAVLRVVKQLTGFRTVVFTIFWAKLRRVTWEEHVKLRKYGKLPKEPSRVLRFVRTELEPKLGAGVLSVKANAHGGLKATLVFHPLR